MSDTPIPEILAEHMPSWLDRYRTGTYAVPHDTVMHDARRMLYVIGELVDQLAELPIGEYVGPCCGDHDPACALNDVGDECCADCPDHAEERQRRAADDELRAALGSAYFNHPACTGAPQQGGA